MAHVVVKHITLTIMGSTNQTCRNCGGGEFYSKEIELAGQMTFLLPIGFTLAPRNVRLRVCGTCGLMDWFVAPISLDKVKEKFQKDS